MSQDIKQKLIILFKIRNEKINTTHRLIATRIKKMKILAAVVMVCFASNAVALCDNDFEVTTGTFSYHLKSPKNYTLNSKNYSLGFNCNGISASLHKNSFYQSSASIVAYKVKYSFKYAELGYRYGVLLGYKDFEWLNSDTNKSGVVRNKSIKPMAQGVLSTVFKKVNVDIGIAHVITITLRINLI